MVVDTGTSSAGTTTGGYYEYHTHCPYCTPRCPCCGRPHYDPYEVAPHWPPWCPPYPPYTWTVTCQTTGGTDAQEVNAVK